MNKVKCPKCGSEQIVALEHRPDEPDYDIQKLGIKDLPSISRHVYAGVKGYDNYYAIARCLNDECRIDYLVEKRLRDNPWEVQSDERGDVLFKYNPTQVSWLRKRGFLKPFEAEL